MAVESTRPEERHRVLYGTNAERVAYDTSAVEPTTKFVETDTGAVFEFSGVSWYQRSTAISGGAAKTADGFKPSQYDADLTMDGTGQSVALATGVKLGGGRIKIVNRGATTEAIRIAFGTSSANAISNLNIAAAAATTGDYWPSIADSTPAEPLGVPALATYYAVANAVAADVQVVSITQGL